MSTVGGYNQYQAVHAGPKPSDHNHSTKPIGFPTQASFLQWGQGMLDAMQGKKGSAGASAAGPSGGAIGGMGGLGGMGGIGGKGGLAGGSMSASPPPYQLGYSPHPYVHHYSPPKVYKSHIFYVGGRIDAVLNLVNVGRLTMALDNDGSIYVNNKKVTARFVTVEILVGEAWQKYYMHHGKTSQSGINSCKLMLDSAALHVIVNGQEVKASKARFEVVTA